MLRLIYTEIEGENIFNSKVTEIDPNICMKFLTFKIFSNRVSYCRTLDIKLKKSEKSFPLI